jgi:hypothetical protein
MCKLVSAKAIVLRREEVLGFDHSVTQTEICS